MHRSRFADDPDMHDLIQLYVQELSARVESLTQLLEKGELEPLRRVAHQLKGSGGGYGFDQITTLAAAVDRSIKANADLAVVRQQVVELIEYIQRVEGCSGNTQVRTEAA